MWILKNSKELLEHLQSPNFNQITNIKSFEFSTLYTTIPHKKLKSRLATIIRNSFIHKNGNRRYKFLVLGREVPYCVKEHSDSKNKCTEDSIINMLEFLVDNMFVIFGEKVFQQIVGIPIGTNCAPLLADIFLYSYEAEFIQSLLSTGKNIRLFYMRSCDIRSFHLRGHKTCKTRGSAEGLTGFCDPIMKSPSSQSIFHFRFLL